MDEEPQFGGKKVKRKRRPGRSRLGIIDNLGLDKLVATFTKSHLSKARVDPSEVAQRAKEITERQLGKNVQSDEPLLLDKSELELFVRIVRLFAQMVEAEQMTFAVREILEDSSTKVRLTKITEAAKSEQLKEVADQVARDIMPSDPSAQGEFLLLVLGAAVVLAAAGAVMPLLAAPVVQAILTNEIAIAGLTISAAALIKQGQD